MLPDAKPVPHVQAVPLPHDQVSLRVDGGELCRYRFGGDMMRPFVYPVIGPSGRGLTRMGHPHDPITHRHHYSVWTSHHDVDGVNFWADHGKNLGRIEHQRIQRLEDGDDFAAVQAFNHWVSEQTVNGKTTRRVHMHEHRRYELRPLRDGEWLLIIDIQFEHPQPNNKNAKPVVLGQTPFGVIGVRMAKSLGVHDGGGLIRNSEGLKGEQGPNGVFRKPARWVDYSGLVAGNTKRGIAEGITLMDHPGNPTHPTPFHVRGDGWMGACLNLGGPILITPGDRVSLRYGLYIHRDVPSLDAINKQWAAFAKTQPPVLDLKRRR